MTSAWVHAAILSLVSFCIITPVNAAYEHLSSVSYIACKTYQMTVGDPTCLIGKHYLVSQKNIYCSRYRELLIKVQKD